MRSQNKNQTRRSNQEVRQTSSTDNSRRIFQTFERVLQVPDYVKHWCAIVGEGALAARRRSQLAPRCPHRHSSCATPQIPSRAPSTAAIIAFRLTPNCYVINPLPGVGFDFQATIHWRLNQLPWKTILPRVRAAVTAAPSKASRGLTNSWLFCPLRYAGG